MIDKNALLKEMCGRCRMENDGCPCEQADCFIHQVIISQPSITINTQKCIVCGTKMPGAHPETKICNSCRNTIIWAKRKMRSEIAEKANERMRKEDEERWRKIMQGTV